MFPMKEFFSQFLWTCNYLRRWKNKKLFQDHYYKKDFMRHLILLTEAGTKRTCLLKYLTIFGGGRFIYRGGTKLPDS